jgi:hypothetical protein
MRRILIRKVRRIRIRGSGFVKIFYGTKALDYSLKSIGAIDTVDLYKPVPYITLFRPGGPLHPRISRKQVHIYCIIQQFFRIRYRFGKHTNPTTTAATL